MLGIAWRGLRIDASFTKQLPVQHEYMRTYLDERVAEFRGANRVLIALVARDGNMFTPEFFEALKRATDEVSVMDGIDRGRVQSLYTPNVRYLEVVEDGIEAGNVIPADFQPTPEGMAQRAREHPQGRHRRAAGGERFLRRAGQRDRAGGGRERQAGRSDRRGARAREEGAQEHRGQRRSTCMRRAGGVGERADDAMPARAPKPSMST